MKTLRRGELNNCLGCGACYGQYNSNPNSEFSEYWCVMPTFIKVTEKNGVYSCILKEPKGICQFCNPKSIYYLNK